MDGLKQICNFSWTIEKEMSISMSNFDNTINFKLSVSTKSKEGVANNMRIR